MGQPHPTIDAPGAWPELAALVDAALSDPFGQQALLAGALRGGPAPAGHLCATGWALDPARRAVLLVRHARLGWSTPGGHVARGESPLAAAQRELSEETGLAAAPLAAEPLFVHGGDAGGHRHYNLAFAFGAGEVGPLVAEAGAPAAWVELDRPLPEPHAADLAAGLAVLQARFG